MVILLLSSRRSAAEAADAETSGVSRTMGLLDPGAGLADELGGEGMWFIPLKFTLRIRKTRTNWSVTVQVKILI